MYKIEINNIIANNILKIHWDENNSFYFITKKINDVDFKISKFYSDAFTSDEGDLIKLNDFLSKEHDDKWDFDSFDEYEFLVLEFESEEEALYFKLKYGGESESNL